MTTALFIGRFQPLHKGHLRIIRKAAKENKKVIIVIGSAQYSGTRDNPFSAKQRKEMIIETLKGEKIKNYKIILIKDIHCDGSWVSHVINHTGNFDKVYAAESKKTNELFKKAGYKVISTKRLYGISSTKIRKRMRDGKDWERSVPEAVREYLKKKRIKY
ncbi:nicotinamide-nucleotide adenylyltransferase [Candidatus Woesearchaeota archaeon]|nr:nicotinamide-nucleotide adenylyltransferase [Candidatus Woesearchaeota archaeon]